MSREGLRAPIWAESGTEGLVPELHFRASNVLSTWSRVGRETAGERLKTPPGAHTAFLRSQHTFYCIGAVEETVMF